MGNLSDNEGKWKGEGNVEMQTVAWVDFKLETWSLVDGEK